MPIVNYEEKAKIAEKNFFKDNKVSEKNKKAINKFLVQYDVSPARLAIFLKHITLLLRDTKDITQDMNDRDNINKIFKKLRDKLGMAYYGTVVNVSKRFVRWLNDGELPKGFIDIKNISKKNQRRNLEPKDMLNWDDGLELAKQTPSTQIKTILLTQLDGGFRPSEFVDLNYGDVSIKKDFIIVRVRDGKTGKRNVILWRSIPYLLRWMETHPTKISDDPLWVVEYGEKSKHGKKGVFRYEYKAISKRIMTLGERINFKKPLDFYSLRHSACFIAKKDNMPIDEAAKKFGHSITFFTEVYGRLSVDDSIDRLSKHYGIKKEEEQKEQNQSCSKCGFINEPKVEMCFKCGSPLSIKKAMELDKNKEVELEGLKKEMEDFKKEIMHKLIKDMKKEIKAEVGLK